MRRLRVTACLAAAAGTLIGCCALVAPAASASTGFIDVESFTVDSATGNPGLLSVQIASDMPLTSLTVSVLAAGSTTPALTLPMSDFATSAQDGTGDYGPWTLSSPITTGQLPVGSYNVEVTAASADATVTDAPAGVLDFLNEVTFPTFTSNGTTFDFDNQNVTFTGTADVTAPGGTPQPFGTEPLVLEDNDGDSYPFTTAADGSFTITVAAKTNAYSVEYVSDATTEGSSAPITITVTPFTTSMTAALSVPHARSGQADSVSGTLTYSDGGVSTGLANTTVSLYSDYYVGATPTATAVTDQNGKFTMPVPTTDGSLTWTLESTASEYFDAASASLPMTVAEPNYVTSFRASLSAYGVVTVTGCVGASSGTAEIQYATRPSGPWTNLGAWKPLQGTGCGNFGQVYQGTYNARLTSAYYRATYIANNDHEGAVSKSVHLSRLLTKITSFRVSPRSGAENSHFTVSGRLWAENKKGRFGGYAHRKVILVFHIDGSWYRYPHEMTTNSAGDFSGRFPIYDSTPVFAQYNGDKTHFASATSRIKIKETRASATAAASSAARARTFPLAPPLARQLQAS
jgi:hypothetical protein